MDILGQLQAIKQQLDAKLNELPTEKRLEIEKNAKLMEAFESINVSINKVNKKRNEYQHISTKSSI